VHGIGLFAGTQTHMYRFDIIISEH